MNASQEKKGRRMKRKVAEEEEGGVVKQRKKMAGEEEDTIFPLLSMMERLPGVFEKEVVSRLNDSDIKFFARESKRCRDGEEGEEGRRGGEEVGV